MSAWFRLLLTDASKHSERKPLFPGCSSSCMRCLVRMSLPPCRADRRCASRGEPAGGHDVIDTNMIGCDKFILLRVAGRIVSLGCSCLVVVVPSITVSGVVSTTLVLPVQPAVGCVMNRCSFVFLAWLR